MSLYFRQYELGCLSHFSYLIADDSTGRAVVVDPQRDIEVYLETALERGLVIEQVMETHVHADFVSGHLELAAATGASISYGSLATTEFASHPLQHGQRISLGTVELEIRHTPGHTTESVCIVVREHPGADPWGVLTGDTLFIGDVGRPDLLTSAGSSADALAGALYRSLHEQLLTLPDSTRVYPAHGAGSACGKHLSEASHSTIGEQRATNYALAPMSRDEFVQRVSEDQRAAPPYFSFAAALNRSAHELLDEAPPVAMDIMAVFDAAEQGAILLDTRSPEQFAASHLDGSVNVGLEGRFAEYAGDVVRPGQPIVLIADPGTEREAKVRLARIGFDSVLGALRDLPSSLTAHPELERRATRLNVAAFEQWRHRDRARQIVDLREAGERVVGAVPGALPIPLGRMLEGMAALDPRAPTVVYCAGGSRSSIAASLLRAHGFTDVSDLLGGYSAWSHRTPTVTERRDPSEQTEPPDPSG